MGVMEYELLLTLNLAIIAASAIYALFLVFSLFAFDFFWYPKTLRWENGIKLVEYSGDMSYIERMTVRKLAVTATVFVLAVFTSCVFIEGAESARSNESTCSDVVRAKLSGLQCWEVRQPNNSGIVVMCFGSTSSNKASTITLKPILVEGN